MFRKLRLKLHGESGALAADLGDLLESGEGCDVTLVVGSLRQPAHKAVLAARSPVFAAMFRHQMQEACDGSVSIADVHEELLQQLLTFMYTDRTPLLQTLAVELLVAADKYDLPLLKRRCEEQLVRDLSVENATATAVLAVMHSCTHLKVAVIKFINAHPVEVMTSDGWIDVMRTSTEIAVQICRLMATQTSKTSAGQTSTTQSPEGRGSLAGDMAALLESGDGSDVTLVAGGSRLPAHRAVLAARSAEFTAMLRETTNSCVTIKDIEEEVLKQVLRFIYTDQVPQLEAMADKLLVAAVMYGLTKLKAQCERQIADNLHVENVAEAAVLAVTYSCSCLKSACISYITRHCMKVMGTDGWKTTLLNHAETAVEICSLVSAAAKAPARTVPQDEAEAMGERLRESAEEGRVEEVRQLLDAGAAVNACRNVCRLTPLHEAASRGHVTVVRLLAGALADVNARSIDGSTPLHIAAMHGQVGAARALLQAGADKAARDSSGRTARGVAVQRRHQELVDILN